VVGSILESTERELKFKIKDKLTYLDKEIAPRIQSVSKTNLNMYSKPLFNHLSLNLFYLNEESLRGLYKNPNMNLPYEIRDSGHQLIYRQEALIRTKENVFSELEKAAIDEGLRN
jgi:hypothetical protein